MLSKVPGKDVTVQIIAARVRMDMKVGDGDTVDNYRTREVDNNAPHAYKPRNSSRTLGT